MARMSPVKGSGITRGMFDRRDRIYAELGVPPEEPEDALDRWQRMKAEREEPEPRERVVPPTLDEIDQRIGERIAAEHQFMCGILAEVVAHLQDEWVVGAMGPPGPAAPAGRARTARQAAAGQAVDARDRVLRGRRRLL
jgi:hypothetical protein